MLPPRKAIRKTIVLTLDTKERVKAVALERPDLGVRRLTSVLSDEGIDISESAVRSALLKEKLHTRELRLRNLEERHLKEGIELSDGQKQALEKFNPCLSERSIESRQPGALLVFDIVDLLKFPQIGPTVLHAAIDPSCCLAFAWIRKAADFVAAESLLNDQIIPFYRQNGIIPLAVLNGPGMVLNADGEAEYQKFLETQNIATWSPPEGGDSQKSGFIESFERKVRTQFLVPASRSDDIQGIEDLQKDFAVWLARYNAEEQLPGFPNMGRTPMTAFQTLKPPKAPEEEPEPRPAAGEDLPQATTLPAASSLPRVEKRGERTLDREKWIFRAVNAALVCLVVYFGWMIASELLDYQRPKIDSGLIESLQPEADTNIDQAQAAVRPLYDYDVVWRRNLFGVSKAALDALSHEKMSLAKIAVAGKDVGLKLIGTVVTNDPMLNYAVIDITTAREQGIFRERERVGKVVIRRILRNNVIIETEEGLRRRLTVDNEEVLKKPQTTHASLPPPPEYPAPQSVEIKESAVTLQIPRDVIQSSMSNIPTLMEEVNVYPHLSDGNPDGFAMRRVSPSNVLARIGLRSGDVIKGIGDDELEGPEDAEMFFRRLAEGGEVSILVERRGQLRRLNINIK